MTDFQPWLTGINYVNIRDKERSVRNMVMYMLNRTNTMFKWNGLPESVPQYILEQMLQANGHCIMTEYKDKFYVFTGGYGGNQDEYYRGKKYVVANPGLNLDKEYDIGHNCILGRNDHLIMGVVPIFNKYASLISENEITLLDSLILSRSTALAIGSTDKDVTALNEFFRSLEKGNLGALAESAFVEGIKTQPLASTANQQITNFIESEQFLWAKMFNEIGLDSNYNMKREALTTTEGEMNSDALLPLVDDMKNCREEFSYEVNKMYGLNLTVEFNSSWKDNEIQIHEETEESEVQTNEGDTSVS